MKQIERTDIGHGFNIRTFTCVELNPEPIGIIIEGPRAPSCPYGDHASSDEPGRCGGGVHFGDAPSKYLTKPDGTARPTWTVEQEDPLTLSPSLACKCNGQHGFVRDGRYVPA